MPEITRSSQAVWNGGLKSGTGTITSGSKTLNATPYNFLKRFENEAGTNPEELIAAAHAACFSMALSADLEKAGFVATEVHTSAAMTLNMDAGPKPTKMVLTVKAKVPKIDEATFKKIAEGTRTGCPISKALAAMQIELHATLVT